MEDALWILAILAGVSAVAIYRKRARNSQGVDANAARLYQEIAEKLSEQLNVPPENILRTIHPPPGQDAPPSEIAIQLECTFRKLSSTLLEIEVVAVYLKDGNPMTTSLVRKLAWDDLPADVRRDFIRSGKSEIHYKMKEPSEKENQ